MTKIDARKLKGPWAEGYALDVHTASSEFLGYDGQGHEQFATTRSEMGDLLYRTKYKGDDSALDELVEATAEFIKSKNIDADVIVAAPPTRQRKVQPLFKITDALGKKLSLPVCNNAVRKTSNVELKNLHGFEERSKALQNAITVDAKKVAGKRVLLVDDLVGSGATIHTVTEQLQASGAKKVSVIAMTQTRRK
jgi:competence protein ComFC